MPESYLFDTNTVTALANGNSVALGHLHGLAPADEIYTCFIVVGEWEYGMLHAPGKQKQAQIRMAGTAIFAALTGIWDSTRAISIQYGTIHAQLRAIGQVILPTLVQFCRDAACRRQASHPGRKRSPLADSS